MAAKNAQTDFDASVDGHIEVLKKDAEAIERSFGDMIAGMQGLVEELSQSIPQDRILVEFSDDEDAPLISFSHPGGDVLADLRADTPSLFIFETYSEFDELDQAFFEQDYFIYTDLSTAASDLMERLAVCVARYEFACMQELS